MTYSFFGGLAVLIMISIGSIGHLNHDYGALSCVYSHVVPLCHLLFESFNAPRLSLIQARIDYIEKNKDVLLLMSQVRAPPIGAIIDTSQIK